MTNEEMERAIDFLLKSQANFEARLEQREAEWERREARREEEQARRDARIDERFEQIGQRFEQIGQRFEQIGQQLADANQQIAEMNKQLGMFADTQAEFMQVVTRTFDEQARVNKSVAESLKRLAESQAHTDRRLNALIDFVRDERDGG